MPLVFTLAARNLFHDRLRFAATLVGIVFSMILVTVQMGLYLSFARMVTTMIDHAGADLWIMPSGTKCFEDPSLLGRATTVSRTFRRWSCKRCAYRNRVRPVANAERQFDAGVRCRIGFQIWGLVPVESGRWQFRLT